MKRWIPFLSLFALLSLDACATRDLLYLVSEPYADSQGGRGLLLKDLSGVAAKRGLRADVRVAGITDPVGSLLAREFSRGRVAVVAVDPLFCPQAAGIASGYPKVSFILVGGLGGADTPPNVVRLLFDRRDAFQTMGAATALSLLDSEPGAAAPRAGSGPPSTADIRGKVGVLVPRSRLTDDQEIAAFSRGLAEPSGGAPPIVKQLPEPVDRETVQKAVRDLRGQGVEAFLPRLGELNSACMDALRAAGGWAVTEDWQGSRGYPEVVFLSVEEDVMAGIDACIVQGAKNGGIVNGPARVVCGGARPVPKGMEGRISCP